jgi:hypothetical protein
MPRKKVEVSDLQLRVIEDMAGRGAVLDDIAYVIGIPPATLDRIKGRDERVELAYRRGRAIATDNMATRLWNIAQQNTDLRSATVATIFWLKAQAKWSDKQSDDEPLEDVGSQVHVYIPENGRAAV